MPDVSDEEEVEEEEEGEKTRPSQGLFSFADIVVLLLFILIGATRGVWGDAWCNG